MSAPGIELGSGIQVGRGISIGATPPSLTIHPADFTTGLFNTGDGTAYGTNGYLATSAGDLNCPLYTLSGPVGSIATTIGAFFYNTEYDITKSYVYTVTFATGPTGLPYNGLVRMGWTGTQMKLTTIDQSNPGWQDGSPGDGTSLTGEFLLPMTLTPYNPVTMLNGANDWC